jgi:crotonobetainyl-CoA:carnitine CoA-transferase CaiB-like acyl-CoA transferase
MRPLLSGIRVLDLTSVVLGPYATLLLADMGAEVIKIEPPEGEICRALDNARHPGMGPLYLNLNRNKKSVKLDLKNAEGREALLKLADSADVLVHNVRPGAIKRLGITYDTLAARNPRLVYCAAWGFREDGPYGNLPAYDDVVQAASGLAALNAVDGVPRYMPTIVADKVTGLYASNAILAALMHRERTGKGQYVEVPMLECLVSFVMVEHLSGATFDPPLAPPGYVRMLSPHRRPFRAKDGYIAILPYMTDHWVRFLKHVGHAELAESELVRDPRKRSMSIGDLYAVIAEVAPAKTRAEWFQELKELEIPCMPVNELGELLTNEHLEAVGLFKRVEHPTEGDLVAVDFPVRFSGVAEVEDRPAPVLDADGDALRGLRRSSESEPARRRGEG